jgi:hypothetical protein
MLTPFIASFPRLARLFYLYRCPPFKCFSLVLFFLFFGVGFRLGLTPFWGYLSFVSHALVCFIGSFEPFRIRLDMFFAYPLTELLEIQRTS